MQQLECRGLCKKHYYRWRANGDPNIVKKPHRVPVVDGKKPCSKCQRLLPVSQFSPSSVASTGLMSQCSGCRSHGKRAAKYGLSRADFERMAEEQSGRCRICGEQPGVKGLVVDHDHSTGAVRALLCGPCNSAIGLLREDPAVFASAVSYLKHYKEV
ncbi:endonuclease VII domain-containing protein [Curtobacterium sp. 'Ferrero']|uniref:endonuclease VII domain-containing protein n=1 Tax=Curtobacterium sp. 'Ferrero' TaxID=2033654 RepID=UPI001596AD79|nr:endonuclease VII domain-containing protein [Curtobacterium sp. 'Ferrero']